MAQIKANGGKTPHLAAVLVGHDGGRRPMLPTRCAVVKRGLSLHLIRYEEDVTEEELLACVERLNNDPDIDGFIVQLPLPKHIREERITEAIDYRKDVDGFHPVNVGRMALGLPASSPQHRRASWNCSNATTLRPAEALRGAGTKQHRG